MMNLEKFLFLIQSLHIGFDSIPYSQLRFIKHFEMRLQNWKSHY
jgi:hypothetical protein